MLDTVPQHTPSPGSANTQPIPDFPSKALEAHDSSGHVSPAATVTSLWKNSIQMATFNGHGVTIGDAAGVLHLLVNLSAIPLSSSRSLSRCLRVFPDDFNSHLQLIFIK